MLAVGDMHGELTAVRSLIQELEPDVLLCCGDWGDPGQLAEEDYVWVVEQVYTLTVFGNHDDIKTLSAIRNGDGSPILLANGEVRRIGSVRIAGISGIWAKSHRQPWYITDQEVIAAAKSADRADVLITHSCGIGLADMLPGKRHGGHRCFLDAFKFVGPSVYICGHLHVQQIKQFGDGRTAVNVGNSANREYALVELTDNQWQVTLSGPMW